MDNLALGIALWDNLPSGYHSLENSPVVVKDTLNVCICGRVREGGGAGLVGDQGVEGVHHGQQVHHLRLVLRQVLSGHKSVRERKSFPAMIITWQRG